MLTTREYILNRAKDLYERLDASRFDLRRCTIEIEKYTKRDRAQILFTHLYISRVPPSHVEALIKAGAHRAIATHRDFNPRVVEWMTTMAQTFPLPNEYVSEFLGNLSDQTRLWAHAFERQLSPEARALCLTLATMPATIRMPILARAFECVSAALNTLRDATQGSALQRPLRELDGSFIRTFPAQYEARELAVSFHNPSIRDFAERVIRLDGALAERLLGAVAFYEQVEKLATIMSSSPVMTGAFAIRWQAAVADRLKATLGSEPCEQSPWMRNICETRLRAAMGLASTGGAGGGIAQVMPALVGLVANRARSGDLTLTPWGLHSLFHAIPKVPGLTAADAVSLAKAVKEGILSSAETLESFRCYFDAVEPLVPSSGRDLVRLRRRFRATVSDILEFDGLCKEDAHSALRHVEDIAERLCLDYMDEIEDARSNIESWDEGEEMPAEPRSQTPKGLVADASDDELDAMFDALLRE